MCKDVRKWTQEQRSKEAPCLDSDMDMNSFFKYSKKGPNSLGANDGRRIPIRQRILHPSMLGYIDIADTSSSDPKLFWGYSRNCGEFLRA